MRGSLLMSFFDYEVDIADYVDIFVNGNLLRRIYSASDRLYSIPIYNGDNVTVTYYSPDNATISTLTLKKKEYTSDSVNGDMGIVTTTIVSGVVFTSYSFTVSVSSKAYDFDYYFDNGIVTQFQLLTENSDPILTESSKFINIEPGTVIPKITKNGLQLYLDANNPLSYSGTGTVWYDLTSNANDAIMSGSSNPTFVTTGTTSYFQVNPTSQSQNQFFIVPDSPSLDVSTGVTMEMWVYYENLVNTTASVLNKQDPSGWTSPYGAYDFRFNGADSQMWIAGYSAGPVYTFVGGTPQNGWNQYVVTWDNINLRYKIYLNGSIAGTSSPTSATSIQNTPYPLWIGADAAVVSENFTGYMSIIRIYDRAITADEIFQNYSVDSLKFM